MGPDVIEGVAEVVEVALLGTEVGLRRASGFALEGSVHALVTAVLLRLTRLDGLGTDAEPDPERPVDNVITLDELRREDIAPQRLNATLFSAFAILALVVAGVGVLGVLAFSVTQRTKEFGVRLALGAEKGQGLRMVLGEGARLVLGALLLGGVASVMLSRLLSSLLFGTCQRQWDTLRD